jgi:hypothetical protein
MTAVPCIIVGKEFYYTFCRYGLVVESIELDRRETP